MASPTPPQGPPVVRLAGVRLRYGKAEALRGIDLNLSPGRMIGLIGRDQHRAEP